MKNNKSMLMQANQEGPSNCGNYIDFILGWKHSERGNEEGYYGSIVSPAYLRGYKALRRKELTNCQL